MKLFKFTCGVDERVGIFADAAEANDRRAEVDPTFQYVATTIEELRIPGYQIVITPTKAPEAQPPDEFDALDRKQLTEWLKSNNVDYVPQWGDTRLRETARQHAQGGSGE